MRWQETERTEKDKDGLWERWVREEEVAEMTGRGLENKEKSIRRWRWRGEERRKWEDKVGQQLREAKRAERGAWLTLLCCLLKHHSVFSRGEKLEVGAVWFCKRRTRNSYSKRHKQTHCQLICFSWRFLLLPRTICVDYDNLIIRTCTSRPILQKQTNIIKR